MAGHPTDLLVSATSPGELQQEAAQAAHSGLVGILDLDAFSGAHSLSTGESRLTVGGCGARPPTWNW